MLLSAFVQAVCKIEFCFDKMSDLKYEAVNFRKTVTNRLFSELTKNVGRSSSVKGK